jgi:zinc transporter 2
MDAEGLVVRRRLYSASALCCTFLVIEVIGGYLSGSLAVLSDAAHLFADLASFGVAIIAAHLASLPTTEMHTFGLKRAESLAALLSMISLALVSIALAVEAIRRLLTPHPVDGKLMTGIAAIGVMVNVALALVLGVENHVHLPGHSHGGCSASSHDHQHDADHHHEAEKTSHDHSHDNGNTFLPNNTQNNCHHDHSHNHASDESTKLISQGTAATYNHQQVLHSDEVPQVPEKPIRNINLHAAYLHVMGDLAQSIGVLISGIAIWINPDWHIVDTICTLFFCVLVFYSTLGVLRSSISVLLEEVPPHISWKQVFEAIQGVEGVTNVHDLHIWSISHGTPTMSVHCTSLQDPQLALERIYHVCRRMGIQHATIQIQTVEGECVSCSMQDPCNDEIKMELMA